MRVRVLTYNNSLVVSAEEAKSFLRITHDLEDALIERLILSAQMTLENFLNRFLLPTTVQVFLDRSDLVLAPLLPFGNYLSVESVKFYDLDGNETSLTENTDYILRDYSEGTRIYLPNFLTLHANARYHDTLVVVGVCGWASVDTVPSPLKTAVLQLTSHLYDNREIVSTMNVNEIPQTAYALSYPYRLWWESE